MPNPFQLSNIEPDVAKSPQSLFNDLKREEIRFLWAHQNDILKAYTQNHLNTPDVALELPTGAGKTLIGLLIGEWRRKKDNLRTVYLCPTRQLAFQVEKQARKYGIVATALVGPQRNYDPTDFAKYIRNESIAITTYSGLFNSNPRFNDPQLLILDDAHASENYIPSMWSLEINRRESPQLYIALLDMLQGVLPTYFLTDMRGDNQGRTRYGKTECAPLPLLHSRLDSIKELLDEKITDGDNERWSWSMIRENLHACHIFVDWAQIIIRPIIPPTFTHQPFKGANQRLYMSATLGEGGELERSLGVKKIERLPIPENWDKQTGGRRLILFPSLAFEETEIASLVCEIRTLQPRSLVLCPDNLRAEKAKDLLAGCDSSIQLFSKADIEENMSGFIESSNSALVLTNRYDGIDLPDESCRLEIVFDEPSATNLQERFYLERLKANLLLQNRIQTRIAQALGRCVRSSNDYALILMVGQKLGNFCAKKEVLSSFHPELQAEIDFGLKNSMSQNLDAEDFTSMAKAFFNQDSDWEKANSDIISFREKAIRSQDASLNNLAKAATYEVLFSEALWQGNFEEAQIQAQAVIDCLNGRGVISYKGWWYYLAGSVAWIRSKVTPDNSAQTQAVDLFSHAVKSVKAISWLIELQRLSSGKADGQRTVTTKDVVLAKTVENLLENLDAFGRSGIKFEKSITDFETQISGSAATAFELGLEKLGKMLGYLSERPNLDGAPDGVWEIPGLAYVVFEAKSDQIESGPIGKRDAQQTKGHIEWLIANRKIPKEYLVLSVIVSPRTVLDPVALPHAEGIYWWSLNEIRNIAKKVVAVNRDLRAFAGDNLNEPLLGDRGADALKKANLDPESILKLIKTNELGRLAKKVL